MLQFAWCQARKRTPIMVCAPSLLSTRPCGFVGDLAARSPSDFKHQASSCAARRPPLTHVLFPDLVLARDCCCCPSGNQVGTSKLRSLAAGRRGRCAGAVRMSSTPAQPASVASKDGDAENATKTVNVIIKGKVQGVYYRNWTIEMAQQLDVNGWVRNLKDGSVEAVFSGKSAVVDSLIEKCHSGPSAARVSSVEVSSWKDEVPQGFERKPTIW